MIFREVYNADGKNKYVAIVSKIIRKFNFSKIYISVIIPNTISYKSNALALAKFSILLFFSYSSFF